MTNEITASRRSFLIGAAASVTAPLLHSQTGIVPAKPSASQASGFPAEQGRLAAWVPGTLEIHHIATGRGNCAFILGPDGSTLMIDAGAQYAGTESSQAEKYLIAPVPDASRRPGEWIARYVKRRIADRSVQRIDAFLLTHLHIDHMGGLPVDPHSLPQSTKGDYLLTGVMDVHERIPIQRIYDHAFPTYDYPQPLNNPHQLNYRAFIRSFVKNGGIAERFQPGALNQIAGSKREESSFRVRNLAANGVVWTGTREEVFTRFPPNSELTPADRPNENMCSAAILLSFGAFRYYSGGDLVHETQYGRLPWADIEADVARVASKVDVAVANHHGYVNGCGPEFIRQLRPNVLVISACDSAHPVVSSLDNMLSRELYPEKRIVLATALKPENRIATKRLEEIQSAAGHVVVRVSADALSYEVLVVSSADETDAVTHRFGPYRT